MCGPDCSEAHTYAPGCEQFSPGMLLPNPSPARVSGPQVSAADLLGDPPADAPPAELGELLGRIAGAIGDEDQADGPPRPAVAGTFAMYPDGTGGLVIVMDVHEGPDALKGPNRARIGPGLIRTVMALAGGGGGLMGRAARAVGRRKGISA